MALLDGLQLGQSLGAILRDHQGSRQQLTSSVDKAIEAYEKGMFARMEEVVAELTATQDMLFHEDSPNTLIAAMNAGSAQDDGET